MHRRQAYGDRGGDWSDAATSRGTTGATRSQRRKHGVPPWRRGPTDSLVSDSGLLNRERLSSCCFRTLRVWEFVTAAYSGVQQDPRKEWGQDGWDTAVTGLLGGRRGAGHGDQWSLRLLQWTGASPHSVGALESWNQFWLGHDQRGDL